MRYADHLDYLVAAISYLARSGPWARTPTFLANELGLDRDHLQAVFDGFPGLFRKSRDPAPRSGTGQAEHYYSLQARYAQRPDYGKTEEGTKIPPLTPAEIEPILEFVLRAVEMEKQSRQASWTNWIAVGAAVVSALAAITVALFDT